MFCSRSRPSLQNSCSRSASSLIFSTSGGSSVTVVSVVGDSAVVVLVCRVGVASCRQWCKAASRRSYHWCSMSSFSVGKYSRPKNSVCWAKSNQLSSSLISEAGAVPYRRLMRKTYSPICLMLDAPLVSTKASSVAMLCIWACTSEDNIGFLGEKLMRKIKVNCLNRCWLN